MTLSLHQAAPLITWASPASITYGTALSVTQLNATASVPGTLVYTPAAGSVPRGWNHTLSVTFTPTDTANYTTATKTVTLIVTQAAPVITWDNPAKHHIRDGPFRHTTQCDDISTRHSGLHTGCRQRSGCWHRHAVSHLHSDRHHELHDGH